MAPRPSTRPKNTVTFAQAIEALRGDDAIKPTWLRGFNDLSEGDLVTFQSTWLTLSLKRRTDLVAHLLDLAQNDIELNFNAIFRVILTDSEELIRLAAIAGLGEEDQASLIDPLLAMLKADSSERVRAAAADALGRFALLSAVERLSKQRHTQIYKALLSTFRAAPEESIVHQAALRSLGYMLNDTVAMYIRAAYASDIPALRRSAIIAMGRSEDRQFAEFVRQELSALEPEPRLAAAEASGELEDEDAVKELKILLDDHDSRVRKAALTALAQIGNQEAHTLLSQSVLSPDEEFAKLAGEALELYDFWHGEIDFSLTNFEEDDLKPRSVWQQRGTPKDE